MRSALAYRSRWPHPGAHPCLTRPACALGLARAASAVAAGCAGSSPAPINIPNEKPPSQDTGVVWRTGQILDPAWQRGFPESFMPGSGQVLPGWGHELSGLPVGSRVLLVTPPSMGYGSSGDPPNVKTSDTVVFVIDILSAVPAPGCNQKKLSCDPPIPGLTCAYARYRRHLHR